MKNKSFKVACFQTKSSNLPEDNINLLSKMFSKIKNQSIDLVCLPECVAIFSDSRNQIDNYLNQWNAKFLKFISDQAYKNKTFILIGSLPVRSKNNKFLNRSLLISSSGRIISFYDKINLFDVVLSRKEKYLESQIYNAGKKLKIANLPWGKLGMSICYDIRFPNLYKKLALKGADFISIPAAFTHTTGEAHWHSLIRARAIENGCFIFAPAQLGHHKNGRRTFGHSMIVNPWGDILKEAKRENSVISEKIDVNLVSEVRMKIPSTTQS